MPIRTIYVGRGTGSPFGNPVSVEIAGSHEKAVEAYKRYLEHFPRIAEAARTQLAGYDLACWCRIDQPCHADVLLEIANPPI